MARRWSSALASLLAVTLVGAGLPAASAAAAPGGGLSPGASRQHFGVGQITVTYVDRTRRISVRGRGAEPRPLETIIRYPTVPGGGGADVPAATPAPGSFPLIVFAHGFDITPAPYARLLDVWARAGYVVVAPIFPLSNPSAPGGPDESDLVNQPADMSFVISRVLTAAASGHGPLAGLVDRRRIAVAGQSDGGSTALAAAYNQNYFDRRIRAAMILSGAMIPGIRGYDFPSPSSPLLAVQGTADTLNAPTSTYRFFGLARHPKFLLSLLGAPHLGPYTNQQPQLGIVERVTIAFLDRFLKHLRGAGWRMWDAGRVPGLATLRT